MIGNWTIGLLLIFTFTAQAETQIVFQTQTPPQPSPQPPSQGQDQDRKQDFQQSRDEARKKNQDHFQPEMASKFMEAAKHFQDAQEAREQKNYGKAEQDQMLGQMKQMQGQQLKQQIDTNEDSAKKNDMGSQKLTNPEQVKAPNVPGSTLVISLRDPNYNSQASQALPVATEAPKAPIPNEQLADLGAGERMAAPAQSAPSLASSDESMRSKIGYDETPKANNVPISSTSLIAGVSSSGGASTSPPTPPTLLNSPIMGASNAASSGSETKDFWKGMGSLVDADNQQVAATEARLNPRNLRGASGEKDSKKEALPGAGVSDEAFWKKVGKIPTKCMSATEISKHKRQSCLRTARRDFEKKWREGQRKPASAPAAGKTLQAKNTD